MEAVYRDLVPGGTLRAAVNFGNPVLVQRDAAGGEPHGLAIDLVDELARRLAVPRLLIGFDGAGSVFEACQAGAWDMAFLATDSARALGVDFTAPFVVLEGTYVVRAGSPYRTVLDLDRPGTRIAVGRATVYDAHLTRTLRHAELIRTSTSMGALDRFLAEGLDAAAGLKQPLAELVQVNRDLRLIEGRFAAIELAIAVPKGRAAGLRYLNAFVDDVKASRRVAVALERLADKSASACASPHESSGSVTRRH
jgi:polar amino acid transport system substrate-binding protein